MDRSARTARRALGGAAALALSLASALVLTVEVAPAGADGPQVVVSPDHVYDGQQVGVDISGFGPGFGSLIECAAAASVEPTFDTLDSGCQMLAGPYIGAGPPAHEDVTVDAAFAVFDQTRTVDCRTEPGGCVVGVIIGDVPEPGRPFAYAFAPITFVAAPSVALAPASGLLDGQAMTLTATGLEAGGSYRVQHCWAASSACAAGIVVDAGNDGGLTAEVPALQRFTAGGRRVVCRSDAATPPGSRGCSVRLVDVAGGAQVGRAAYAMAQGSLAVTPHGGLVDGQVVQVTGRDLMATYDGPPILGFPTGTWSVVLCSEAVLAPLSLAGALTHCAAAPTTRAVDVPGSTLDTTLEVRSRFDRIMGGTTDCTTIPGGCLAGLLRLEQDGSMTAHLVPVSFASDAG